MAPSIIRRCTATQQVWPVGCPPPFPSFRSSFFCLLSFRTRVRFLFWLGGGGRATREALRSRGGAGRPRQRRVVYDNLSAGPLHLCCLCWRDHDGVGVATANDVEGVARVICE